jgi:hypothetical protein
MNLPARPHASPCACPQCSDWARAIVATEGEKKPRRGIIPPVVAAPEVSLDAFLADIKAAACRATGKTEEQLLEMEKKLEADIPRRIEMPERLPRESVASRGVLEMHLCAIYDQQPVECDALARSRSLLTSDRTLLVLSGGTGTRKSGSASWALTRKAGRFITADEIGRIAGSREGDNQRIWQLTRGTPLLVIDDLGGEYVDDKGWFVKVFNSLVDYRYGSKLKTIITSNLDAKTFKNDYGERVTDRIREAGAWTNLGGASARRRA